MVKEKLNAVEKTYYERLLYEIFLATTSIEDDLEREHFKETLVHKVDDLVDILLER